MSKEVRARRHTRHSSPICELEKRFAISVQARARARSRRRSIGNLKSSARSSLRAAHFKSHASNTPAFLFVLISCSRSVPQRRVHERDVAFSTLGNTPRAPRRTLICRTPPIRLGTGKTRNANCILLRTRVRCRDRNRSRGGLLRPAFRWTRMSLPLQTNIFDPRTRQADH